MQTGRRKEPDRVVALGCGPELEDRSCPPEHFHAGEQGIRVEGETEPRGPAEAGSQPQRQYSARTGSSLERLLGWSEHARDIDVRLRAEENNPGEGAATEKTGNHVPGLVQKNRTQ